MRPGHGAEQQATSVPPSKTRDDDRLRKAINHDEWFPGSSRGHRAVGPVGGNARDVRRTSGNRDRRPRADLRGPDRQRAAGLAEPHAPSLSVTVLIPAHNEESSIVRLVEACRQQAYPLDEIVVVADSCTDRTAELAATAGARVVETDCKDKAGAQNSVLWDIESDVIVGFDGDTKPEPECIERMLRDLHTQGYDATCSTILPWQEKGFLIRARRFSYAMGRRWWRLCQAKVGCIQVLTGASYAFRTEAIRSVGGFPSGLISADMDATWAMHSAGYKLGYTPDALALTKDPTTFRVWRLQMRRWAAGYAQTMAKYRRQLLRPRAMLVVATAVFDLASLFVAYGFIAYTVITGNGLLFLKLYWISLLLRMLLNVVLVATVVGAKEAILGFFPWLVMNFYTRWLYLAALSREWILGRHYSSWTGRQGRATVITPMSPRRKAVLTLGFSTLAAGAGRLFRDRRLLQSDVL